METAKDVFARRLKELRDEKKMSLEDLAKLVNLSKTTLNKYELKLREPMMTNVIKISQFFNVDINWLTGFSDERNPIINQKTISEIFAKLSENGKLELFNYASFLLSRENKNE